MDRSGTATLDSSSGPVEISCRGRAERLAGARVHYFLLGTSPLQLLYSRAFCAPKVQHDNSPGHRPWGKRCAERKPERLRDNPPGTDYQSGSWILLNGLVCSRPVRYRTCSKSPSSEPFIPSVRGGASLGARPSIGADRAMGCLDFLAGY